MLSDFLTAGLSGVTSSSGKYPPSLAQALTANLASELETSYSIKKQR